MAESTTYQDYFDRTALAESTSVYSPLQVPLAGDHTFTVDADQPQLGDRTFGIKLLIERRS